MNSVKLRRIYLIFNSLSSKELNNWKKLYESLEKNFTSVEIISFKKYKYKNTNYIFPINFTFLFKNINKILLKKNKNLLYLSQHPFFKKGILKLIPDRIILIYIQYSYVYLKKLINISYDNEIFIMEPKNFLYTPLVIILEQICKELNQSFTFIHWSYFYENLKFYKNLERIDYDLIQIFNNQNKSKLNNENLVFLKQEIDRRYRLMMTKKNNDTSNILDLLSSLDKKKKNIVISLTKEFNYREFYFLESQKDFNLNKIIQLLNDRNFNVILRKHPLSKGLPILEKNFFSYIGSLNSLNKSLKIHFHLSTSTHSYFDAISLNIPVIIWSKKDTYSLKNIIPYLFVNNLGQLNYYLDNYQNYNFSNDYLKLLNSLIILLKKSNLNFDKLGDIDFSTKLINNFFKNKYSLE